VLVQCAGLVWTTRVAGSEVETVLFGTFGWPDQLSFLLDRVVAIGLLAVAVVGLFRPMRLGYVVMAAWFVALPLARWSYGGVPFEELSVTAHAVRWAAPLALAVLPSFAASAARQSSESSIVWLLRGALAATFFTHGVEALRLHPQFIDYLLIADRRVTGFGLDQAGAEIVLQVIGVVDIACAAAILVGRLRRDVLGYMVFWGLVTAGARVLHSGEHGVHEALIRAGNGGVAAALWLVAGRVSAPGTGSLWPAARVVFRRLGDRRLVGAFAVFLAAGGLTAHHGVSGQDAELTPRQLRLTWAEDPAHHARISWSTTAAGGEHVVHYDIAPRGGDVSSYSFQTTVARSGRYSGTSTPFYHHVELEGLTPSTTYWFVVETDGQTSEELHFVTGPVDDRPFELLYGGDSRSSSTDRRRMNQRMAELFRDRPTIVALGHGGDYIATASDWSQWNEWLDDHVLTTTSEGRMLPVIPTRGNHEGDGSIFNAVFGFPGGDDLDYFTTVLGANATLITLDSNVSHGGDQRAWLETQLEEAQARRWIVPGYHRPAYPAVKTPGSALEHWVPLFEQYNVDLVCESDGHALKRTVPIRDGSEAADGIVYVGEGGLGVGQRTPVDYWYLDAPGMSISAHHVQLLSFSPEALRYQAIAMDGEVLDTYETAPRRDGVVVPVDPGRDAGTGPGADGGMPPVGADGGIAANPDSGGREPGPGSTPGGGTVVGGCAVSAAVPGQAPGAPVTLAVAALAVFLTLRRRR
jgi:hypothetical protein